MFTNRWKFGRVMIYGMQSHKNHRRKSTICGGFVFNNSICSYFQLIQFTLTISDIQNKEGTKIYRLSFLSFHYHFHCLA